MGGGGGGYFTSDGQSVSMSRYRAPLWDLRPDITSCRNVGPGPRIYIPQEQGGPVIPPGTEFLWEELTA
jgi:hypothetical protein